MKRARRCFTRYRDTRLLVSCALWLMKDDEEGAASFLGPWLWGDRATQAYAAAAALAGRSWERPAERLRAAILTDRPDLAPPLTPETERGLAG